MKDYSTSAPKWRYSVLWVVVFILFFFMIANPNLTASRAMEGCITAVKAVLPSTFPYLVLSSILVSSGCCEFLGEAFSSFAKPFSIHPSCFSVVIVSILCGFPVGGAMTSDMYEKGLCTKEEAERLISFCNFCGPPYIFGVFGNAVMKDSRAGLIAFLTQSICGLVLGIILGIKRMSTNNNLKPKPQPINSKTKEDHRLSHIFCSAICKAGASTVNIFGYIIFFSVLCGIISNIIPITSDIFRAFFFGIIEISNGMEALKNCERGLLTYFTGCLITYFSGFSVHLQVISTLHEDISPKKYLLSRIIFAPLCAVISTLIYWLI